METALQTIDLPITFVNTILLLSPQENFIQKNMSARILGKVIFNPGSVQQMQQLSKKKLDYPKCWTIQPDLRFQIFLAKGGISTGKS